MRTWIASLAITVVGLATYAFLIEPRWLQLRRSRIHIRSLPRALEGLRIGLLTDIHAEGPRSGSHVRRAVRMLARQRPDLIAITGDLAEDAPGLHAVADALAELRAPLGVFTVPGNHDHVAGIESWRQAIQARTAVHDLTNRYVLLDHGGARVCVGGVDDYYEGQPRLLLPPPGARDLTVVLAHSPDQAERCRRGHDAVDLIVSGHTHGGQVRIPFVGAPVSSAEHPDLYDAGLRRRPWTQVYTSRGVGTTGLPVRFFARPEVSILTLTATPRRRW